MSFYRNVFFLLCPLLGVSFIRGSTAHSIYVGDQLETWTVLKPSDGFKTGQTALKRAGRL